MTTYTGQQPALIASGGYTLERGLATVQLLPQSDINVFDVTNALQLTFDVQTNCGHNYCTKCITDYYNKCEHSCKCPYCRQPITSFTKLLIE